MILRFFTFAMLCIGIQLSAVPAFAMTNQEAALKLEAMTWYAEDYPPFNYPDADGVPTGMAVEILMAAFAKIGAEIPAATFKIVPWTESYKTLQKNPGTALFSMTYTPERQRVMKFVGPSIPIRVSVIVRKTDKIKITTEADLAALKIGAVRDDIGDQLIRKLALSDDVIARKNTLKDLFYFFSHNRVNAVAYSPEVFFHYLKSTGGDPSLYEEAYVLKEGQVGYAFNMSTSADVLATLQRAIDELRVDGTIDRIISSYTK